MIASRPSRECLSHCGSATKRNARLIANAMDALQIMFAETDEEQNDDYRRL